MAREGLYHSLVTTQMAGKEEEKEVEGKMERVAEEEVVMVTSDALENLNLEDSEMPSLISIGSFSETFGRKKSAVERRISVLSNYSTYSEESFGIENALGAATSAIAIGQSTLSDKLPPPLLTPSTPPPHPLSPPPSSGGQHQDQPEEQEERRVPEAGDHGGRQGGGGRGRGAGPGGHHEDRQDELPGVAVRPCR